MALVKHLFPMVLLIATCSGLLAACGESTTPTTEMESPVSTAEPQSTPQSTPYESPMRTPTAMPSTESLSALPTPAGSDVATVGGVFMRDLADGRSEPSADTKLQLARVIRDEDGTPLMASAGEKSSPIAVTGEDGAFVFTDVPSDMYALVVITPIGSFMVRNETGEDFLIDVEPGGVLDLGEVHTELPY
jgi:hypothetical protein